MPERHCQGTFNVCCRTSTRRVNNNNTNNKNNKNRQPTTKSALLLVVLSRSLRTQGPLSPAFGKRCAFSSRNKVSSTFSLETSFGSTCRTLLDCWGALVTKFNSKQDQILVNNPRRKTVAGYRLEPLTTWKCCWSLFFRNHVSAPVSHASKG